MSIKLEAGIHTYPNEREIVKNEVPHCPMCERPFEGINDYPKIIIKDLIISPILGFVRNTPQGNNIAEKIKDISKRREVKGYLKKLSSVRGDIISLSDFKPDLPEYEDKEIPGYYKLDEKYYLHIVDSNVPNAARVVVMSHINTSIDWGFLEVAKLAVIKYEGVLNHEDINGI